MLKTLLNKPGNKLLLYLSFVSLIGFIILTVLFQIFSSSTNLTGFGIMDFELAFTAAQIANIFNAWNAVPGVFQEQLLGVYLDWFLYIPCYVIFLCGLILLLIRKFEGKMQTIGLALFITPLLAGIFDIVENFGLLTMLNDTALYMSGTASDLIPMITSICASVKFILLLIAIIFALIALIHWLFTKSKAKN